MSSIFDFFRPKNNDNHKKNLDKNIIKESITLSFDEPKLETTNKNFFEESDVKINKKFCDKKSFLGHRQRLKEKTLNNNIENLIDYELLELILTYSIPRVDVKPLAKYLLNEYQSLKNIFLTPYNDFKKIPGIGENTLCFFKIIHEIYCRFDKEEIEQQISLGSPEKVAIYCKSRMGHLKHEQFRVLFMNRKNKLIKDLAIQDGTVDRAAVFPRELILKALDLGASGLILVHNHPSGDPSPSRADIELTDQIKKAAHNMEISVFDHIIIGKNRYYSMKNDKIYS